jgi:hypothetical protein
MNLFLWSIPLLLLALLLFLMLRNRAYKVCPWFFAYVTFGVSADMSRYFALNHPRPYFATYWITEAGYCILGILAMYEVFRITLRSLARIWWTRNIFPALLIAGVSLSLARAHTIPPRVSGLLFYIVIGEIAVRFVQVFIFLGVATLMALFGLRWRRYSLGVAAGFGFYATVALVATIKFSDLGPRFRLLFNLTTVAAYSLATLIWIWFFRVPEEKLPRPTPEQAASTPGATKKPLLGTVAV